MQRVTQSDIETALAAVGLARGDLVFVHSSLSAFGHVEGGAQAVVRALLSAVGPEGTLAVPIFRTFFTEGQDQVWDRDRSPSLMGAVSEAARTWPGALRSGHAPHPIAAIGPLARELTEPDNTTDFAFDSPFSLMLERNAKVLLMGVSYNRCTMVHILEERCEIPYRHWVVRSGAVVERGIPRRADYPFLERYPGVQNDFTALGALLERQDLVRLGAVGSSTLRCFRSRDLYEEGYRALCADPLFLVSEETKAVARQHVPGFGAELDAAAAKEQSIRAPAGAVSRRLATLMAVPSPNVAPSPNAPPRMEVRRRSISPEGLILEEVIIHDGLGDAIPGMLAIPAEGSRPFPAAICLHGTGESWQYLMERTVAERGTSLRGWARELARRGFAALAITQRGHPPRRESWDWEWPKLLLPYGRTAMGRFVADVAACADALSARPEIDAGRIAVGGYSLGGIISFYSFAIDPRLCACFTFCGGIGSVKTLIRTGNTRFHSPYYYLPGLLSADLDHPRVAEACAARPLLVMVTEEDAGMPLAGVREFEKKAAEVYERAGAAGRLKVSVRAGPHQMNAVMLEEAAAWLSALLLPQASVARRQR